MSERNVSGAWSIVQSNGYTVGVNIEQHGGDLSGDTWFFKGGDIRSFLGVQWVADPTTAHSMQATGKVAGDTFTFDILWNNGTHGQYTGEFQPNDRLAGFTFDAEHPTSQATWVSDQVFAAPAPSKPVRRLGKKPVPATTSPIDRADADVVPLAVATEFSNFTPIRDGPRLPPIDSPQLKPPPH
ncbi:MAG: hypothetical protein WBV89_18440 [Ilumatobacter sp.]